MSRLVTVRSGQLARSADGDHSVSVPRRPRLDAPGAIQHVIAKGNAGERIVADDRDREVLLSRLGRAVGRYGWSCLAYCVLDTHFHLIVTTHKANLGAGMKWLLGPYAQNFNYRHQREGHLFRGRFYSRRIESPAHLTAALIYVSLNPVRAGVADAPERWPWSSYAAMIGRAPPRSFFDVSAALELIDPDTRAARLTFELAVRDARDRSRVEGT
jgi:putative transposase